LCYLKYESKKTDDFNSNEYAIYAHLTYIFGKYGENKSNFLKKSKKYAGECGNCDNMQVVTKYAEKMRSHNRIFPGGLISSRHPTGRRDQAA